jgi:hypothetical protein
LEEPAATIIYPDDGGMVPEVLAPIYQTTQRHIQKTVIFVVTVVRTPNNTSK